MYSNEMEYKTLRDEILKRIELRQQHIQITLGIAGAFLGFGLQTSPSVALIYPPIGTLLVLSWAQNEYRMRDISKYISNHIEKLISGLNWETYRKRKRATVKKKNFFQFIVSYVWRSLLVSYGGTFLITQLMAVLLGYFKFMNTSLEWALIGIDFIAILFTLIILTQFYKEIYQLDAEIVPGG